MTHAYTQLRNRIAGTLLNSLASQLGPNEIYKGRTYPKTKFPCISVYTGNERLSVENPGYVNTGDQRYRRILQVTVEINVSTNDDPEGDLDALQLSVEQLIAADPFMGTPPAVIATDLVRVARTANEGGERAYHTSAMVYEIDYRTTALDPETFLR